MNQLKLHEVEEWCRVNNLNDLPVKLYLIKHKNRIRVNDESQYTVEDLQRLIENSSSQEMLTVGVGVKIKDYEMKDGVKVIKEFELTHISMNKEIIGN